MAEFTVTKVSDAKEMDRPAEYELKTWKEAETKEGGTATILVGTQRILKEQLETQKVRLQAQIDDIDAKLAEIAKL